jgi:arylsulfatase
MHDCGKPHEQDRWELYDLAADFSESRDLAALYPGKLAELKSLWASEWSKYGAGPLAQPPAFACAVPGFFDRDGND